MSRDLHNSLLSWFDAHGRDLPWREAQNGQRDPYRVWVSEVLLQQTQVARGRFYFERFLSAFPNVHALAAAPVEAVLKAWEGCGYYARARHLHRAAQIIAEQGLPSTYEGWRELPGVGHYTAAAVSSIAFGEARAVNDGNVRRVLARLYAVREPSEAWVGEQAQDLLFRPDPGQWNEAVMDLGATVCVPKSPRCGECPLTAHCLAFASGEPGEYPAPKKRAAVREVLGVALLIGDAEAAYLETRAGTLLGGLSGLPVEEVGNEAEDAALTRLAARLGVRATRLLGTVTHRMTHRRVTWRVYAGEGHLPRQRVREQALSRLDHKALSLARQTQAALFEL